MGLDMFLQAEKYVSGYSFNSTNELMTFHSLVKSLNAEEMYDKGTPGMTIKIDVGYWRKANHIHKWLVDNCDNWNDDNSTGFVSREKLIELRGLCERVLRNPKKASELLPTTDGFFFGSTDYDYSYLSDLEDTIDIIDRVTEKVPDDWSLTYCASW